MKNIRSNTGVIVKRKTKLLARLFVFTIIALVVFLSVLFISLLLSDSSKSKPTSSSLIELWDAGDYETVYESAGILLDEYNFNTSALMYRGFSSFYLALSQTNNTSAQMYIDESINTLRIALYDSSEKLQPQISYILGKAYFQKNLFSSYHYYSDLVIKYLQRALSLGYTSNDIPEYLGLSYANLGMTQKSIEAFTEALLVKESDVLLLAIAQQYYFNNNYQTAKQYLYRVKNESKNDVIVIKSKTLLAEIYIDEENLTEAIDEYESILTIDIENADAYYGMGVIYEKLGDDAKARAEWRKALKMQVNHQGAIKKLGL